MPVVCERSMTDPELATSMELVQLPQDKGHLIYFPFELNAYTTGHFKK